MQTIVLMFALVLFAYGPSLGNSFVWDDEQFIYNNSYVRDFAVAEIFTQNTIAGAGESSTYYRPLTTLSFAVDHAIWGFNPFGFHLTNTLLHFGAGLLLFFYLKTLGFSRLSSLTISSIFLVHPLQTEAVVYANSRGDSMYTFWAFFSLLSFALLIKKKYPQFTIYDLTITFNKTILLLVTVAAYVLAILGKEIGIATLGLIGLTFMFAHYQTFVELRIWKIIRNNVASFTAFVLSLVAAATYLFMRTHIIQIPTTQNDYFAGTAYGESVFVRLHTFTQALWHYFRLLLFPYPLHMERSIPVIEHPLSVWLIATILLVFAFTYLAVQEYKKSKTGYILFGSLWFLAMLVPVSGIIPVNGLIYEHWLYVPLVGFLIAVYGGKTLLPHRTSQKISQILKKIVPIIVLLYIFLTIRQNYLWSNPVRFYSYTLQFTETARLRNNLAMAHAEAQNYEAAISNYQKAIQINDTYPQTHYNLGNTLQAVGETALAKKEYATAIRMNENFMPAYVSLVNIFLTEQDYENAESLLKTLTEKYPSNYEFAYNYAQALLKQDKHTQAEKVLEDLLLYPDLPLQAKILVTNALKEIPN